jgi:MarR family transcriptional regulator, organic hydroperoxide resistance regulator
MHLCDARTVTDDRSLSALAEALNALYRLSGSARVHAHTVAATGVQVSRTGLRFLSLVADSAPISASVLATALDVSQPTASRVLQQLENDGLVVRRASTSDGRVSHYLPTAKGRRALARVHRYHVERLAQVLAEVDEPRREALAGAVTELVDRLQDASRAVVDPALAAGARPADRNTA